MFQIHSEDLNVESQNLFSLSSTFPGVCAAFFLQESGVKPLADFIFAHLIRLDFSRNSFWALLNKRRRHRIV